MRLRIQPHIPILALGFALLFSLPAFLFTTDGVLFAQSESVEARRARLEAELVEIEKEIQAQQILLDKKRVEAASVERDIAILNAEIRKAQLEIRARNITINDLSGEINEREQTVFTLNEKIGREKNSLAQLLRRQSQIDDVTLVELVLGSQDLSEFFADVDSFERLNLSLQASLAEIRTTQKDLNKEKEVLADRRRSEADAKAVVESEKRVVERHEQEKQELLAVKESEARSYEQVLEERRKKAAEIRAALFALRDTAAIPFGEAYEFAKQASAKTGVRPAFILAVLKQESNLGENVGQCFFTGSPDRGGGVGKNTGRYFSNLMHPDRDVGPFLDIANRLGFDPYSQVLSCPQSIGYGGAMGPSQFIPSTWESLEAQIANLVGVPTPNPWEPRHAFHATALYLSQLGADFGGYSAEREAAARYYAGGYWESRGLGYADSVLAHARDIQENMIDPLENF